jgi:hypothetical protein
MKQDLNVLIAAAQKPRASRRNPSWESVCATVYWTFLLFLPNFQAAFHFPTSVCFVLPFMFVNSSLLESRVLVAWADDLDQPKGAFNPSQELNFAQYLTELVILVRCQEWEPHKVAFLRVQEEGCRRATAARLLPKPLWLLRRQEAGEGLLHANHCWPAEPPLRRLCNMALLVVGSGGR